MLPGDILSMQGTSCVTLNRVYTLKNLRRPLNPEYSTCWLRWPRPNQEPRPTTESAIPLKFSKPIIKNIHSADLFSSLIFARYSALMAFRSSMV